MDNQSNETLQLAMKEYAEELTRTNQLIINLTTVVNNNGNSMNEIRKKFDDQKIGLSNEDKRFIEGVIDHKISALKTYIDFSLARARTNNWQAFLQSDAKKWLVILLVALTFLTYLYWFAQDCLGHH